MTWLTPEKLEEMGRTFLANEDCLAYSEFMGNFLNALVALAGPTKSRRRHKTR